MPKVEGGPESLNTLLEEVYNSCMATKKDKGVCSATAWSAAKGAGWHKNKEGKWTKKSAEEMKRDDLIKKGGIKVKNQ